MKEEKENKSTITFGEIIKIMQDASDRENEKRGFPKRKIEPFISDEPETKIKIAGGNNSHRHPTLEELNQRLEERRELRKRNEKINQLFILILVFGFFFIRFRLFKLFIN